MSSDYFLGVNFNIASCALLLSLVARLTGYTPRWLSITTNDSHLYENHIEQVQTQLTREPYPLPSLSIADDMLTFEQIQTRVRCSDSGVGDYDAYRYMTDTIVGQLENLRPEWFTLKNYQHHEAIAAPMAV